MDCLANSSRENYDIKRVYEAFFNPNPQEHDDKTVATFLHLILYNPRLKTFFPIDPLRDQCIGRDVLIQLLFY